VCGTAGRIDPVDLLTSIQRLNANASAFGWEKCMNPLRKRQPGFFAPTKALFATSSKWQA